ncbi:DEAD/DEAH box helicase [Nocardioides cynanchi]|uniref:DEAD/DEAH box helicase n=1 Tax=Nocardioides cynanchi TaxID=2558918 RepID=UPI001EE31108|nr:DEAD/DEAH box helicase [Nocardioides cynanchi]
MSASHQSRGYPVYDEFAGLYDFPLDDFQRRACHVVEEGQGVLVAAPTGSGKTVVGEFAVHLALQTGRKCFYTTPIKALSNQKYHDLVSRYGADQVGLLTGDVTVNGEAPIVVMTTEVLRNMLYAGSGTLLGLGFVVMDEVHYLADRSRGAVWEEVIIHLPESVALVSLSATVSNAEEFGEWLETVRGDTTTIVEERRPVPLYQHVLVGKRMLDLFATSDVDAAAGFVKEGAPVNAELLRVARDDWASTHMRDRRTPRGRAQGGRGAGGRPGGQGRPVGNGRRVWVPSRVEVLEQLDAAGLLPAIVFIFSRVGCDAAVQQCLRSGIKLTSVEERDEIAAYVDEACADLPDPDRQVLGFHDFRDALTRGIASHHAGMLPAFKQCVEQLFVRGLCKAVFATETLALGINMPARTVVLEKLSKWNGETHADITPGEYTQLTGRAGRRGLDVEGHAVVLWQPGINPSEVAGLASTRLYPLRSSFRPSYNMAVNLVTQVGRERARELLEMSFAQFQADKAVVGLARQLTKSQDALAGYAEAATCDRGDFMEYAALRHRVSELEKGAARARKADRREDVIESLTRLQRGDVIEIPAGKFAGFAVVLDPGVSPEGPRPQVLTAERQARRLSLLDFPSPVEAVTRVRIPRQFNARNPQSRRDLASSLRAGTHNLTPPRRRETSPAARVDPEVEALRQELRAHPCHDCPEREAHARWSERWYKLDRDARTLERRVEQRTNTVARQFDRVCEVLATLGYLAGDEVTELGRPLRRIYSELDLVVAEALRLGVLDGLGTAALAAALSTLVFEARRAEEGQSPRIPGGDTRRAIEALEGLWRDLAEVERAHRLDFLRRPDPGLAWAAYRWAEGDDLAEVLGETELTAGDFVRWIKQLIDLSGQVADAAGAGALRETARDVVRRVRRGVVAVAPLED